MRNTLFVLLAFALLSCTPGAPYEVRSPCVAIDSVSIEMPMPCVRRAVNLEHGFA